MATRAAIAPTHSGVGSTTSSLARDFAAAAADRTILACALKNGCTPLLDFPGFAPSDLDASPCPLLDPPTAAPLVIDLKLNRPPPALSPPLEGIATQCDVSKYSSPDPIISLGPRENTDGHAQARSSLPRTSRASRQRDALDEPLDLALGHESLEAAIGR